jgi:hypothetical protein
MVEHHSDSFNERLLIITHNMENHMDKAYQPRPVVSVYYRGQTVVKTTHSTWPNNAVCNAIRHMQVNEYDATHCEVYGGDNGKLYAVIKWGMKEITILYRAKIDDFNKFSKDYKESSPEHVALKSQNTPIVWVPQTQNK